MSTVTADIAVSLDGDAAGPNQSEELPFGEGLEDERLHTWMFKDGDQNRAEVDAILGAGAYIMGRNMFGHGPGEWDLGWTDSVRSTSSGCTSCPSRSVQASGCSTASPG
jgi:hypothetical protein